MESSKIRSYDPFLTRQVERAEDNLCSNTTNMSFISKQADGAEKVRKDLERALMAREDTIEQLENKHKVGRTVKSLEGGKGDLNNVGIYQAG